MHTNILKSFENIDKNIVTGFVEPRLSLGMPRV